MATITDYIDWRGDISFAVSPFNEVDSYIISKLGSPDFTGIVPGNGFISVREAVDGMDKKAINTLGVLSSQYVLETIRRLPETPRYEDLRLGDYVSIFDEEKGEQFSALTVILPDNTRYIAFRGTDDTLLAWKEDFMLGATGIIPAQWDAAEYLRAEASKSNDPFIIGGHSKGGNLAVFAAMTASAQTKSKICSVYNFDGPGFFKDVSQNRGFLAIRPKLHTIVSKNTTVGVILYFDKDCEIVDTDVSGISAHDGFKWKVKGTSFVRAEGFSAATKAFRDAAFEVSRTLTPEEIAETADSMYSILSSEGAETVTDLTESKLREAVSVTNELRKDPSVSRFFELLTEQWIRNMAELGRMKIPKVRLRAIRRHRL